MSFFNRNRKFPRNVLLLCAALSLSLPGSAAGDEVTAASWQPTFSTVETDLSVRLKPSTGVFNSVVIRTNSARGLKTWHRVQSQIRDEQAVYAMCDGTGSLCSATLRKWRLSLAKMKGLKGRKLLLRLNAQANALVPYRSDVARFDTSDYWASPLEFLDAGGDCEDFAILKYVSLTELGIPESKLRIVVVEDLHRATPHAVLTVKLDGKTYVLDSLTNNLISARATSRFRPLYSVSGNNRWLHVSYKKLAKR
jgi:predicted transglutaminase-like cysteine proteinase